MVVSKEQIEGFTHEDYSDNVTLIARFKENVIKYLHRIAVVDVPNKEELAKIHSPVLPMWSASTIYC
jgi:hypothetical protein